MLLLLLLLMVVEISIGVGNNRNVTGRANSAGIVSCLMGIGLLLSLPLKVSISGVVEPNLKKEKEIFNYLNVLILDIFSET